MTKGVGYGRLCENSERSYDNGSYYCYVQYDLCSPARRSQPDFAGLVLSYPNFRIIPHWIVLNVNHILLPIGFLLSIPLVLASNNWFMVFLADFFGAADQPELLWILAVSAEEGIQNQYGGKLEGKQRIIQNAFIFG